MPSRLHAPRSAALLGLVLLACTGCGQRGPLYLPTDPAAADRATLPQVLNPMRSRSAGSPGTTAPGTGSESAQPLPRSTTAPAGPPGTPTLPSPSPIDDFPSTGTGTANPVRTE